MRLPVTGRTLISDIAATWRRLQVQLKQIIHALLGDYEHLGGNHGANKVIGRI